VKVKICGKSSNIYTLEMGSSDIVEGAKGKEAAHQLNIFSESD
jgi:hypothetical protein